MGSFSEPRLIQGDCFAQLALLADSSIDASVTDPPYFISVLGEKWDEEPEDKALVTAFHTKWAREVFRVLRPGGYLLAFGAPRTVHRMVCGIEDAGFEIRDEICWVHPQNIPKNQDAAKAIDRHFFESWLVEVGANFDPKEVRDLISDFIQGRQGSALLAMLETQYGLPPWGVPQGQPDGTVLPAHPRAKLHAGRGTALKAVWEPIVVARKPFQGTLAKHLLIADTGVLNIDDARIPTTDEYAINRFVSGAKPFGGAKGEPYETISPSAGRYPANLLTSPGGTMNRGVVHIEAEPTLAKPRMRDSKEKVDTRGVGKGMRFNRKGEFVEDLAQGDGVLGSYTRFFVVPKPTSKEKDAGLSEGNSHPTVKPISLMRYLVKMVVPKGGSCLDPFMGSGTTGVACVDEERSFTGIELSGVHFAEAEGRIRYRLCNHDRSIESVLALLPEE